MEQYRAVGYDYFLEITGTFIITGSSLESTSLDFKSEYLESIDYNPAVYDELGRLQKISFRTNAVKKFVPYEGLYPCQKTLELGMIIS